MNCIKIGYYHDKISILKQLLYRKKILFIEVPVARNICVSSYVVVLIDGKLIFRLANKFYETITPERVFTLSTTGSQDKEIIRWAMAHKEEQTSLEVIKKVIHGILHDVRVTDAQLEMILTTQGFTGLDEMPKLEVRRFLNRKRA